MIGFLLKKYTTDGSLDREVVALIHEEVKNTMAVKIQTLIQSAYLNDDQQWFNTLEVREATEEQMEIYFQTAQAINALIDNAQFEEGNTQQV